MLKYTHSNIQFSYWGNGSDPNSVNACSKVTYSEVIMVMAMFVLFMLTTRCNPVELMTYVI